MKTIIRKIDRACIDREILSEAGEILRRGGLVAFPTETVYGLGADALQEEASAKIYAAKGRPSDNPLIVHIAKYEDLKKITKEIPEAAKRLADAFWPGPLTMVFNKSEAVPLGTTGGLSTVAVRMPSDPVALALIEAGGGYVAAPSANTSGRPSPTLAQHVIEDLDGKIDMVIDGGAVNIGLESTIVDMSAEPPTILRPGYINREMIEKVIGPVEIDQALIAPDSGLKPKAPGMKYKHYAPKAELVIVEGPVDQVVEMINRLAEEKQNAGMKVGIIGTEETVAEYRAGIVKSIGSREEEASIAKHLYRILREFDDSDVDFIYTEAFQTPQMGQAIMNRLLKAAGHQIIRI